MSKPIIQVEGIGKSYKISHELKASVGNVSIRDGINNIVRKPIELITGHRMRQEKFWALKDISFEVEQGEVLGIIGKNGSGKSTLLKILSRITEPTKGEIRMHGRVASLLEVGTGFHPELTGRENIFFNGSILGMRKKEIESKFDEIVAFSEVENFLDTPVKFYSSGMYVRLAFAVAAHLDPDILIIDEVLAVGDSEFQKKCLGKMQDVASKGRTVLFVSHNMDTVKKLCSRVILIQNGEITSSGYSSDIVNTYLSEGVTNNKSIYKFTNDEDKAAQFSSIELRDDDSSGRNVFRAGSKWSIDFQYTVKKRLKDTIITMELFANNDDILLSLSSDNDSISKLTVKELGQYEGSVSIPVNLLNPGSYYVNLTIQAPGDEVYDRVENIVFEIIPPRNGSSKFFDGRYFGYIAEKFDWQVNKK